jgi:ABC-2 type transport system ATP-binding protein
MSNILKAEKLSRYYDSKLAVNKLSFELNKGEVLGFLGPNGAGKSTTMKMLSGNLAPSEGLISINGFDLLNHPKAAKRHIGYLPEQPPLYKDLTVYEFLKFCAKINGIVNPHIESSIASAIERCGLITVKKRLIAHLSKGFQQRVGIAQAIIHSPDLVILDEPTSGLDPIQIIEIRQLIREIATEHSVILSTHILPEVEMLCDRVQIINKGSLIFNDSITSLKEQMNTPYLVIRFGNPPTINELTAISGIISVEILPDSSYSIFYDAIINPTQCLLKNAVSKDWQLTELRQEQHSLEDVFLNIIQDESTNKAALN